MSASGKAITALTTAVPVLQLAPGFRARLLTPNDADELWKLDLRCFPRGIAYSRTEIAAWLGSRANAFHLAVEKLDSLPRTLRSFAGGQLGAFILSERTGRRGHIITLDVDVPYRRQGLATGLMQAAERHFSALGLEGMRLEVAVNNVPAMRFYARSGYRVVRSLPRYYAGDLDGLLMHKDFTPAAPAAGPVGAAKRAAGKSRAGRRKLMS